jgi:hypothetical protein
MNAVRTSVEKNFLSQGFFNSLFYTIPIGMFLIACNCMFESVRNYYFGWWIVVLPTLVIFAAGNLYTLFLVYENEAFGKRENTFASNQGGYVMSNTNLATS